MSNYPLQVRTVESDADILARHEGLIRHQARPFVRNGIELDDLMQEGRIALLHAAKSWAGINGASLWSHARKAVFGAILRYTNYEIAATACDGIKAASRGKAGKPSAEPDEIANKTTRARVQAKVDDISPEQSPLDALELAETLAVLTEQEREIVHMTFAGDLDVRAIGEALGISKSTAHDILKRAIGKMRAVVIGS